MPEIFDAAYGSLEKAMKVAADKQAVYSHNLANSKSQDFIPLDFDEELGKAVKREGKKSVIMEEEMAKLSKNSQEYSAYVKLLSQKINILKSVATQGRK